MSDAGAPTDASHYRADIDGLRAVSIVAVVLFHIQTPGFSGGYVGVDVFFVISGFLITRILMAPGDTPPARRLADFYLRRARRILPALIVVLAATAIAAAVLYLAPDLRRFGRNLALSAAMLGNLAARLDGSYFGFAGRFAPIAHLWSVAVEEQFYLVYPLLLLWLQRRRMPLRGAIACLAAVSLAYCIVASYTRPIDNYFLMPTRAWQLLLGALVAQGAARRLCMHRKTNEILAVLAIVTIAAAVHGYGPTLRYPGVHAIPPALAAATLIATAQERMTFVARALSLRPLVFTGLISYSIYLWHSPLFEGFLYYNIQPPTPLETTALLVALYLLSAITWRWIERPFRRGRWLPSTARFACAAGGSLAALIVAGGCFYFSGGWPGRFTAEVQALSRVPEQIEFNVPCLTPALPEVAAGRLCSYGPTRSPAATVLVWGDSHAAVMLEQYQALAAARRLHIYYGIKAGCRPVLGTENWDPDNDRQRSCTAFNHAMVAAVGRIDPDLIILHALWLSPEFDQPANAHPPMEPGKSNFQWSVEQTLARAGAGRRPFCAVLTVPTYPFPLPYALAMAERRGLDDRMIARTRAQVDDEQRPIDSALRALQQQGRLRIADPKDRFCADGKCIYRGADGKLLYRDANHPTKAGTRFIAPVLDACFTGADEAHAPAGSFEDDRDSGRQGMNGG